MTKKEICPIHRVVSGKDTDLLRQRLLDWYDANKRTLPWRTIACEEKDDNVRGYAVWVSEVMLQQTQVATVVDYFNKWISRWPDTKALSQATLDDVNRMWSGLGYYSRGRRLWEGATKVEREMDGHMPRTASDLLKKLPGVGKYTAAAIASIAYGEPVGVVDGNVIRVITRLMTIGGNTGSKEVLDLIWLNANGLLDVNRPGDFNQSMMELGATICTPKNPKCSECPISEHCASYRNLKRNKDKQKAKFVHVKEEPLDIEDLEKSCDMCLPKDLHDPNAGVMNYPRKATKTNKKDMLDLVLIVECHESGKLLVCQRPKTGLLANLLEFPSFSVMSLEEVKLQTNVEKLASEDLGLKDVAWSPCGEVSHQFSHINQTYVIWEGCIKHESEVKVSLEKYQTYQWLSCDDLKDAAISTAMRKVWQKRNSKAVKRKKNSNSPKKECKQRKITSFFNK